MDSEQNKQLVLHGYALFQAGDIDGLLQLFADDIDWLGMPTEYVPFSGDYHGKQEVAQFFADMMHAQEAEHFAPQQAIAEADLVMVTGQARWKVRATGRSYDEPWVHIFTVRNGKVLQFRQFYDTAACRDAFMPGGTRPSDTAAEASLLH
jgi:ketosteroid isomerase-like protein